MFMLVLLLILILLLVLMLMSMLSKAVPARCFDRYVDVVGVMLVLLLILIRLLVLMLMSMLSKAVPARCFDRYVDVLGVIIVPVRKQWFKVLAQVREVHLRTHERQHLGKQPGTAHAAVLSPAAEDRQCAGARVQKVLRLGD